MSDAQKLFKTVIQHLYDGRDLGVDEVRNVMNAIANGEADAVQIGAFLVLLHQKGETADEIFAIAQVLREHATHVEIQGPLLDIVGTGGDGHDTINISTAAAVVLAACGVKVAKHGNRSVSSKSGSADVLEKFGVPMVPPECIKPCVEQAGVAFMFAPFFHSAMKYVVPVRRSLGVKTVFNIMGPLLNPAGVKRMVYGVYTPKLLRVYGEALHKLGVEHALVVNSNGLDELAPVGNIQCVEVTPEGVKDFTIDISQVGIPPCEIADLKGGDADFNAANIREIFSGGDKADNHKGRTIAFNAAAGLYVYGLASSVAEGYKMAMDKLKSGEVVTVLDKWAQVSSSLVAKE